MVPSCLPVEGSNWWYWLMVLGSASVAYITHLLYLENLIILITPSFPNSAKIILANQPMACAPRICRVAKRPAPLFLRLSMDWLGANHFHTDVFFFLLLLRNSSQFGSWLNWTGHKWLPNWGLINLVENNAPIWPFFFFIFDASQSISSIRQIQHTHGSTLGSYAVFVFFIFVGELSRRDVYVMSAWWFRVKVHCWSLPKCLRGPAKPATGPCTK